MQVTLSRAVAATSAAAVLVLGVDYAGFAATGDSLIIGHLNHERTTTTLVKHKPGPALRLITQGTKRPSLAVSSTARVPRLNADLLDGKTASDLATRVTTFTAGNAGDVHQAMAAWSLPLKPGVYQATFRAVIIPSASTEVVCGLVDLKTIGVNTDVYAADSTTSSSSEFPAFVSGAETVRITANQNPGMVCATSTGDPFTLYTAFRSSWTRVEDQTTTPASPANITPSQRARRFTR